MLVAVATHLALIVAVLVPTALPAPVAGAYRCRHEALPGPVPVPLSPFRLGLALTPKHIASSPACPLLH